MTMEAAPPRPPPDENPTWILAVAFAALVIALGTAMRVPSGPTKIITKRINVAKGRDATQSSLFQNAVSYSPSRAVDGNTSGSASAISSTEKNANAWWLVDLGDTYSIAEIKIWNREDCCQDRLKNFYVFVSTTPMTSQQNMTVFAFPVRDQAGRPTTITIGKPGRYVKLELLGEDYLSLAEVEVLADVP